MIELKECCKVPFPEKLFEEFEVHTDSIVANVNTSKILDIMRNFVKMNDEPLFFVLELPCNIEDDITEWKCLSNANDDFDVYFIDSLDKEHAIQCIDALGDFLVKDGMNLFGIGAHESHEEILFGKYNVMTIYTNDTEKYYNLLDRFGMTKTDNLVTAWDTFDKDHPGECTLHVSEKTGKTIYDIPETYKDYGMYLYEKRIKDEDLYNQEVVLNDLLNKTLLVGITYYTHDNELIEQKQCFGRVIEANESMIRIIQKDGAELELPSDLSSTKKARPGEYKLRSTGEIVINPDFLATWNVVRDK